MANPWSGGHSSGGSAWGGGGGSTKSKPAHHGLLGKIVHGGTGLVGHLAKDVEQAAVGLPMGLVSLAHHPIHGIEEIGKTTWQDWSPLFHGHLKQFGHNFYEHPLAPLLDMATVASLGLDVVSGGLASPLTGALAGARGVETAEDVAKLGKLGRLHVAAKELRRPHDIELHGPQGTVYRHESARPATKLVQRATNAAVNRVMPNWKGGEYTRLVEKDTARRGATVGHINHDVFKAFKGIFHAADTLGHTPHDYFRVVDGTMHENLIRFARTTITEQGLKMTKIIRHKARGKTLARAGEDVGHPLDEVHFTAPEGVAFIRKESPAAPPINSIDDVEKHLTSFGRRHTTKSARGSDIMLDEHGNPLLVPDHNVNLLADEAVNSTKLMKAIYYKPTHIWKWLVLQTPRFFVNNAVGNTMMAMFSLNPISFTHGLLTAVKDAHGNRVAMKAAQEFDKASGTMVSKLGDALGRDGDVIDKWYLGPHKEGFAYEQMQGQTLGNKLEAAGKPTLAKIVRTGQSGLFNITHRVAEKGIRRIGISELLRKSPEVKALMKDGKSFREAVDHASVDPAFRSRMQHQMDNILGQYHYYNPVEQHLRRIIPFYGWDRAIMRHTRTMVAEHPGRTAAAAATGESGVDQTKQALGDIPSFMEGVIPLGGDKVLPTQGLNPYASVPDTVNPALALVGLGNHSPGEAMAMQLSPFITGLIETTTGQSLLSGGKLPPGHGGIIGSTLQNVVEGLPETTLVNELAHGGEIKPKRNKHTGKTTPFLYRKNARSQIAALLGVPVKEVNLQRAGDLARRERGEHKGRSSRKSAWG